MRYDDFSIKFLDKQGEKYWIAVESPAGDGKGFFTLDRVCPSTRQKQAPEKPRDLAPPSACSDGERVIEEVGAGLYHALFGSEEIRDLFLRSLGMIADSDDRGLRIKLKLDLEGALVALNDVPWELLYRELNQEFLSTNPKTPVVRYLEVKQPLPRFLPSKMRILVVSCNPSGFPPLELEREISRIRRACARKAIDIDFLKDPQPAELSQRIRDGQLNILHFLGHGGFDEAKGEGYLVFTDTKGHPRRISGRYLANQLRGLACLRLVVLNACRTAQTTTETFHNPFAGSAAALVMAGVPAVLAMQQPIDDASAVRFSELFYEGIAAGDPVDAAVTRGRQALAEESPDWYLPVLYMRAPDGRLFPPRRCKLGDWHIMGIGSLAAVVDRLFLQDVREGVEASRVVTIDSPLGWIPITLYYLSFALAVVGLFRVLPRLIPTSRDVLARTATRATITVSAFVAAVLLSFWALIPWVDMSSEISGRGTGKYHYLFARPERESLCWLQRPIPLMPRQGRWSTVASFGGRSGLRFDLIAVASEVPLHPVPFSSADVYPCEALPVAAERFVRRVRKW